MNATIHLRRRFDPAREIHRLQTYDILMLIVLIVAMGLGAIKGFAWQLASIASIVVSYTVAYKYREPFSQNIQWEPPWKGFLAMLILYVGTSLVIWLLFRMIGGVIDRMRLKEFDRQIGALFGLLKGGLACTLITLFAITLLGDQARAAIVGSRSGNWIARVLDQTDIVMPPELHGVVQPVLDRFERNFQPTKSSPQWFTPNPSDATSMPRVDPRRAGLQSDAPNWNRVSTAATQPSTTWSPPQSPGNPLRPWTGSR
ncbi:MAG: CvpA family protein [Planctomycetota bacterium]